MVKDNFKEILAELTSIHALHPDMRFGMLLQLASDKKKSDKNVDLHNLNDREILDSVKDLSENIQKNKTKKNRRNKLKDKSTEKYFNKKRRGKL